METPSDGPAPAKLVQDGPDVIQVACGCQPQGQSHALWVGDQGHSSGDPKVQDRTWLLPWQEGKQGEWDPQRGLGLIQGPRAASTHPTLSGPVTEPMPGDTRLMGSGGGSEGRWGQR